MPEQRKPTVRKGQGAAFVPREEFSRRFRGLYLDPRFRDYDRKIAELEQVAWSDYRDGRKSPLTRPAGRRFSDASYELSEEWRAAAEAVRAAQREHEDRRGQPQILLICASARNDKSCPGEMSKTFRLVNIARDVLRRHRARVDMLDLSELTSGYRRVIHPCKGCVSTAMPLCHWPCSCYPNHSLGQENDWMNEIYPRWVRAHGVMIITPVYWYQAPSVLKLMMDRMVCADGGNPDPTSTHGKNAVEAKRLELKGWSYPRHLAGRAFSLVVHGDAAGTDILRRSLSDWLTDMHLVPAQGTDSSIDRYIGYMEPYATSHAALDQDRPLQQEVRNAAQALVNHVRMMRSMKMRRPPQLKEPRPK